MIRRTNRSAMNIAVDLGLKSTKQTKTENCFLKPIIAKCRSKWEHSAILLTFIQLPFVIKIFVLSILEWPLKTGLNVVYMLFSSPES